MIVSHLLMLQQVNFLKIFKKNYRPQMVGGGGSVIIRGRGTFVIGIEQAMVHAHTQVCVCTKQMLALHLNVPTYVLALHDFRPNLLPTFFQQPLAWYRMAGQPSPYLKSYTMQNFFFTNFLDWNILFEAKSYLQIIFEVNPIWPGSSNGRGPEFVPCLDPTCFSRTEQHISDNE